MNYLAFIVRIVHVCVEKQSAETNTSDVEEIRDQKRRRNELPGIRRQNRPRLC